MSKLSSNQTPGSSKSNWKGGASNSASSRLPIGFRGLSIWAGTLISSGVLFGLLIWMLLFTPKRTELIVFESDAYQWPLPPNALSAEDIDKFAAMDGKTLSLRGQSSRIRSVSDFWERFESQVLSKESARSIRPRIVWVSMHGIAHADSDDAYLIPPSASPLDERTWINCRELIERLDAASESTPTLLVLDCCRIQANWNIGIAANQFVRKVRETIDSLGPEHLTVLIPASEGEIALESADLNGSVFAYYVQLAIAGAADCDSLSGDRDGWVSMRELQSFLVQHVDRWAHQNRGMSQRPQVIIGRNASEKPLIRSLNINTLSPLVMDEVKSKRLAATIADAQLDPLWEKRDALRDMRLYSAEPIAFRDLEQRILWLESLSCAGETYREIAENTYVELKERFAAIENRIANSETNRSISFNSSLISGSPLAFPSTARTHSIPMAEWIGELGRNESTFCRELFTDLARQPTRSQAKNAISELSKHSSSEFAETRFLRMMDRYLTTQWAEHREGVSELIELQRSVNEMTVPRSFAIAESNRFATDLRVHHWTRRLIQSVDESRRSAEDSLLANRLTEMDSQITEARSRLERLKRANGHLTKSVEMADLVASRLESMAQWIVHPLRNRSEKEMQSEVQSLLVPLVVDYRELVSRLASCDRFGDDDAIVSEIDRLRGFAEARIDGPFRAWNAKIQREMRSLLDSSDAMNTESVRILRAAVSLPLFDWTTRRELRRALAIGEMQLQNQSRSQSSATNVAESGSNTHSKTYSERMAGLKHHPLELLLDGPSSTPLSKSNPATRFFNTLDEQLDQVCKIDRLEERRQESFLIESRVRLAGLIGISIPQTNPVALNRLISSESLVVWHGGRVVDDFWGPVGKGRAFFDVAANDYLDAARAIDDQMKPKDAESRATEEFSQLESRIQAGLSLAADWIRTQPRPAVQLEPGESVAASVMLAKGTDTPDFTSPEGTAQVVIRDLGDLEFETSDSDTPQSSNSVMLPVLGTEVSLTLPALAVQVGADLQAQTIFRGHEYSGDLTVTRISGPTVDFRPYRYTESEVALSGAGGVQSVFFVLDCSASMAEPLDSKSKASRIEIAKSALKELLIDLSQRKGIRVGLCFFGHRVGWSRDGKSQVLKNPGFAGALPPGLRPSQDVELVVPLRRFDLGSAQAAISRIESVEPWGQSPLYLSTLSALNGFGTSNVESNPHVIVITDGGNYQFIPSGERGIEPTTTDAVLAAAERTGASVSILGLAMGNSTERTAAVEFRELCRATEGNFYSLHDSTNLNQRLRDILDPGTFSLQDLSQQDQHQAPLNSVIRIPAPEEDSEFLIEYESAQETLNLQGGEAIQMHLSEDHSEIRAYPYDENVVARDNMVTNSGAIAGYVTRIHQPRIDDRRTMSFSVSWQRREGDPATNHSVWRHTTRPCRIWIDVDPISDKGIELGPTYTFYDGNFVPGQPVPRLDLSATKWPIGASKGRVRIWSSYDDVGSDIQLTSPSIESSPNRDGIHQSIRVKDLGSSGIPIADGVIMCRNPVEVGQVDSANRLRFVLDFIDDSISVSSWRVDLPETIKHSADRIKRQFDHENRIAVHTFYFEGTIPEIEFVEVCNRAHVVSGADRLRNESLTIPVVQDGQFLRVGK